MGADVPCCETKFFLSILAIVGLVCFAGLMAGLTLGLMSLGLVDLEVLIKSGRPQDRKYAVTPGFSEQARGSLGSYFNICDFNSHVWRDIATSYLYPLWYEGWGNHSTFVRLLLFLFFPIAYPISKMLDWMLGKGHAVLLRRAELKTL